MDPIEQDFDQDDDQRCKAHTKQGKPCKAAATEGGLCFFHANPQKVAELGRLGGRRNRRAVAIDSAACPPLTDNESVVRLLKQALVDLCNGKIKPRQATAIAQLGRAILYAREEVEFEGEIRNLEKVSAKEPQSGDEQREDD
jgi:hypothetical protein